MERCLNWVHMSNLLPANIMALRLLFSICQQVHDGGLSLKVPLLIMKPLYRMEMVFILQIKSDKAEFFF